MKKRVNTNGAITQFILNSKKNPHLSFIKKILSGHKDAKIYLVGGMVRDLSLGKDSKDYDMVVAGILPKKLKALLEKLGTVNLVGKNFGVYKFLPKLPSPILSPKGRGAGGEGETNSYKLTANNIDIALPRTEHSFGTGGYRDVEVQSDYRLPIEKDLERRDFTINAMALDLKFPMKESRILRDNFIIDPFGGINDLQKKLIRCVGNPDERFKEDYSRMLRALRFSVQLGFKIEKNTWAAIKKNIAKINSPHPSSPQRGEEPEVRGKKSFLSPKGRGAGGEGALKAKSYIVPREIVAKELVKMFSIDPVASLKILDESGMLKLLMPEMLKMKKCPQPKQFHAEGDVWEHTLIALDVLRSKKFAKEFSTPLPTHLPAYRQASHKGRGGSSINLPRPIGERAGGEGAVLKAISYQLSAELIWALVFHDLGKPYTMTKTDRIRFNEHDTKSAKQFTEIAERLKLSSAGLDVEKTKKIIEKHMILTHGNIENMKETTVEKYFFNDQFPGAEVIMHSFCDISATVPPSGKPDFTKYKLLKKRIASLKSKMKAKRDLPPDILDGNKIMKILKIPPGKKIGEIKEYLRELQLQGKIKTKKEAQKILIKWV